MLTKVKCNYLPNGIEMAPMLKTKHMLNYLDKDNLYFQCYSMGKGCDFL